MEFKELYKGIDSLYVSFKGTLKERIREQLEEKKGQAQSENEKDQARAAIHVDDHSFKVKDKGKGQYAYVLIDAWYHIQISPTKKMIIPPVYVQLASELLTVRGVHAAMDKLRRTVGSLLVMIVEETISRVDLCVDFVTDVELKSFNKSAWVTRSRTSQDHWEGDIFTGSSFGLGGVVCVRLYDKTWEIKKSDKEYLKSIWETQGWSEGQKVWRLEFQMRRNFLKQMQVNSFSDLMSGQNDLWKYCTNEWFRLTLEDKTINKTRWDVHPLWEKLQRITFGSEDYKGIVREVSKSRTPNERALFLNGLGYLTAYAAYKGFDEIDENTSKSFVRDCERFFNINRKRFGENANFKDYTKTKINLKKRKYNIA